MATPLFDPCGRRPLQPKNAAATNDNVVVKQIKSKPKQEWMDNSNRENLNLNLSHHPVMTMYPKATPTKKKEAAVDLEWSLAEELSGIRKKLERQRLDKEKTEKMLKERDGLLHLQMKEMEDRGHIQNQLEIEVDRLFRLKELKSYSMRISRITSLREKQQGRKKIHEVQTVESKGADWEDENRLQSPTSSDSSEIVQTQS